MSQPLIMEHVAISSCSNVDSRCTRDYTRQFTATGTFKSKEELIKWAKEVGRSNSITVVVLKSDSGNFKKKPRVTLGCERSGKCDIRNTQENSMMDKIGLGRRHTGTKKSNCPFRLTGKMLAAGDEWQLVVVEGKHNHETEDTTGKQGHSFQGRLSQEEKSFVKNMYETGMQPMEILGELKRRDKHNKSTPRTIYNACQHLKELKRLDGMNARLQQLMMSRAEKYSFIEKHRTRPKMKTASDLLLTHPTSLELLLAFPTVLIIERIARVSRPCWTALQVYGVTSTNKFFFVALAITSKHGDSYEWGWALSSLRGVMNDYQITMPDIVILDIPAADVKLAAMVAVNVVFHTAKVLLSKRTVSYFVTSYIWGKCENDLEKDSFIKKWGLLIASPTEADFERHVMQLRTEFDRCPQEVEYVIDTWVKPYKEMFVAAWTDKVMHFGTSNTNFWGFVSDYFLIDYLNSRYREADQTVHNKFWEDLHASIAVYKAVVKALLEMSLKNEYNDQYGFPELKKLHGTISILALTLIRKETIVAREIDDDFGENCSCAIRSTHGLPCAHEIARYMKEGRPIPPECINSYWRKLDLEPLRKTADLNLNGRIKRRRLSEEKNTNTHSVQALPNIVESERNSPNAGPSIVHSTQARQPDVEVYDIPSTVQLEFADICPPEMRPYILDVKNVPRDGHCGFRAIASYMGYSEDVGWVKVREDLTNELLLNSFHYAQLFGSDERVNELLDALAYWESVCLHKKHWMTMPDMGHIIASCYNIVLMHLSSAQCFTFFPLRTAPISISISSPIEIVVGFVKDHFVQVYLKRGHPIPPPFRAPTRKNPQEATIWERFHEQRSREWAAPYLSRIERFTSLQSGVVSQENPIPVYIDLL